MSSHSQLLLLGTPLLLSALILSVWQLKDTHSREVYVIWYAFSLFFVIFLGFGFFATQSGNEVTTVCGQYADTCKTLFKYLTGVHDELILVGSLLAIGILPQLLAYLLSGLSGSASPPLFVWEVERIAVLSLIKFLAGFGGVAMGIATGELAGGKSQSFGVYFGAAMFVFAAFFLAAMEIWMRESLPVLWRKHESRLRLLSAAHRFFTRNVPNNDVNDSTKARVEEGHAVKP